MRRYRGAADKPPGPNLSPPPYSRSSTSRNNVSSTRRSSGRNLTTNRQALSGMTTPVSENELLMMRGLATASAPFLDPRTKKPMIPAAGRTIPKLKMADLTSSLAPLVESQLVQDPKPPLTVIDKRIAETLKEVTSTKDMLESFDDAIKVPDMKIINSRVAQLRRGIGPSSHHSPKTSTSRLGNITQSKTKAMPAEAKKLNHAKVSPKNEEQNIRKLMGQLKEKYLGDMESQLGLAIERRPKGSHLQGEFANGDGGQDQSGDGPELGFRIPRPSTNATEITSRIDKVVREWATESQKFSTVMKVPASSKQNQSLGGLTKMANDRNDNRADTDRGNDSNNPHALGFAPGKNKNLAKISTAFRKSLDPISKQDVRELIKVSEDDHVEKLEREHEERKRAHEAVFKNAIIYNEASSSDGKGNPAKIKGERKNISRNRQTSRGTTDDGESSSENMTVEYNQTKSSLVSSIQNPTGKNLVKNDQNEVHKIINEHMEYETTGGPPRLTKPKSRRPVDIIEGHSSKTNMLRSDVVGKALLKYSDSHKKLQNVVNSFTEKVDSTIKKRPGPDSDQSENDSEEVGAKIRLGLPLSSEVNKSTVNSRRRNATAASSTLTRSMKTIDRASGVAQRLGTLMSRVALRNEAYDYEKQQEAMRESEKSISLTAGDNDSSEQSVTTSSIKTLSTPTQYVHTRPNPYEVSQSLSNSRIEFEPPNVPPGVSKLDSSQFGKYVEEMKKVAEKAAASFEKFKERQVKNDSDLASLSEDDEEEQVLEYNYHGSGEAAAVAAAAAEIAVIQEKEKNRQTILQRSEQQRRKVLQRNTPRKQTNMSDVGTSPRVLETMELLPQLNRNFESDAINNNDTEQTRFKFIPDMSYTDQLMLKKLRRLKEKEGWKDASLSAQMEGEDETIVGDVPDHAEIESMIKRSTNMDLPREAERAGMGPISLNAILRSRLNNNNIQ